MDFHVAKYLQVHIASLNISRLILQKQHSISQPSSYATKSLIPYNIHKHVPPIPPFSLLRNMYFTVMSNLANISQQQDQNQHSVNVPSWRG